MKQLKECEQAGGATGLMYESAAADEADVHVDKIMRLYIQLSALPDLRPCGIVNQLFGELVQICTTTFPETFIQKILQDRRILNILPSLRGICATAECLLESHWVEYISAGGNTQEVHKRLAEFPYHENYVDLSRMELAAIHAITSSPLNKIAFIGSGPLPLTSICLCNALSTNKTISASSFLPRPPTPPTTPIIVNIDHNPKAISQSSILCSKLGNNAQGIEFLCTEAGCPEHDLRDFDVVYLAALVGSTQQEKEALLIQVVRRMSTGSLLVVRTAHSLRTLLYPDFNATTEAVLECLEICMVVHPFNHVVNSVIIGRVKAKT